MDVGAKDAARAVRACQRIIASRPEDYRAMSSRIEFVSRLGSEFGIADPQDMKKVKKQHGGIAAASRMPQIVDLVGHTQAQESLILIYNIYIYIYTNVILSISIDKCNVGMKYCGN